MDVPPVWNSAWTDIVSGKVKYQLGFLAAKILLGRLTQHVKNDPSTLKQSAQELQTLFSENADLPVVQQDLNKIFGGAR